MGTRTILDAKPLRNQIFQFLLFLNYPFLLPPISKLHVHRSPEFLTQTEDKKKIGSLGFPRPEQGESEKVCSNHNMGKIVYLKLYD